MPTYLPLIPATKKPAVKGWADPSYPGVTPGEGREAWVGLRADGLVIVDCDSDEAYDYWIARVHEGAVTYIVRTPRGYHFYYKTAMSGVTGPAVAVYPGIDIRAGKGSYVVSPHAPGYQVMRDIPLLPFDATWLPAKPTTTVDAGEGWDKIPEGQRNATLAAVAGTLRAKGASVERIYQAVVGINKTFCDPPIDVEECAAIARSIGRYEPEETYEIIMVDDSVPLSMGPTGMWGDELEAHTARPITYVVEDLIPEGLTILAGKPKIGKSWMALGIAAEVARGGEYMGRQCIQGKALYLALEDTLGRLKRRTQLVMNDQRFPGDLRVETVWAKAPDGVAAIHAFMKDNPDTKLVIIDTLAKIRHDASDRQRGTYQDDYTALTDLKRVADHYGIAVVVIHHLRKGTAEDPLDEVSGTTGLAGAADTILVLKASTLEGRGRDLEEDVAYDMLFNPETCRWEILDDSDFTIVWDLGAWVLECTKPGEKVPSEKALREVGLWSQDEVQRQLASLREDPRFLAANDRAPLYVAPHTPVLST